MDRHKMIYETSIENKRLKYALRRIAEGKYNGRLSVIIAKEALYGSPSEKLNVSGGKNAPRD